MAVGVPQKIVAPADAHKPRLLAQMHAALRLSLRNPRLALAYGAAFIGRGDFVAIGPFFSLLTMQSGFDGGMTAGALLGQAARIDIRGSIVVFYSAIGGAGILFAAGFGGIVFDQIRWTASFTRMRFLQIALLLAVIAVRMRAGEPDTQRENLRQ